MRLFSDEERVYAECTVCCTGWSGERLRVEDKADAHECENPGHKVKFSEEVEE